MDIPQYTTCRMHKEIQDELDAEALRVLHDNRYVRGKETLRFEDEYAKFVGRRFAIGCGNGLDALYLMLNAYGIGEGDEVIVPSNTYYATALAVVQTRATPVFVEPRIETFNINPDIIEQSITEKTKAILVVHLYGQCAEMDKIEKIARRHNLLLFEDCAQAHIATDGRKKQAGQFGDAAAFSFFPTKNLGAFGDAGAVVTDDEDVAKRIHAFGNYGSDYRYHFLYCGRNTRIDEIHAAILVLKLKYIKKWTEERQRIADKYLSKIHNEKVLLPTISEGNNHVWHIFALRSKNRDELQAYLEGEGIHTYIHYPIPMHLQPAFEFLNIQRGALPIAEEISDTELSIPLWVGMTDEEISYVIDAVNEF